MIVYDQCANKQQGTAVRVHLLHAASACSQPTQIVLDPRHYIPVLSDVRGGHKVKEHGLLEVSIEPMPSIRVSTCAALSCWDPGAATSATSAAEVKPANSTGPMPGS